MFSQLVMNIANFWQNNSIFMQKNLKKDHSQGNFIFRQLEVDNGEFYWFSIK